MKVKDNLFLMLIDSEKEFNSKNYDGICGIGIIKNSYNLIALMQKNNIIEKAAVAFYFGNHPQSLEQQDSEMTIGGYNQKFMKEEFTYYKVIQQTNMAWEVPFIWFQIDSNPLILNTNKILLDTGTSFLILSKEAFSLL